MLNMPSSNELDALFQKCKAVLTHPELQRVLEEVQRLPETQRTQAINTKLTSQALMARGIPIPNGMSIATHVGDDEPTGPDPTKITICISVGPYKQCVTIDIPPPIGGNPS